MITAPIVCSPPMINCFRLTGRPPHLSEQTKGFFFKFQITPLFSEFSSASNCANTRVIVKSLLVAGEGEACMSSPHSVRPHCVLLIFWRKKTIHNSWPPRFRRVTQAALVIFPARDPKPLSMNNHGSLKSICSECIARIKFYPKNDQVDDLIRRREFVC